MPSPDLPSVVAGLALIAFGAALVADAAGAITLGFSTVAPVACATVGAILLTLGLSRGA